MHFYGKWETESDRNCAERQSTHGLLNAPAADALHANPFANRLARFDDANALQVRLKHALVDARDLLPDPAEVLRLTAVRLLIPNYGFLLANPTMHTHRKIPLAIRTEPRRHTFYRTSTIAEQSNLTREPRWETRWGLCLLQLDREFVFPVFFHIHNDIG